MAYNCEQTLFIVGIEIQFILKLNTALYKVHQSDQLSKEC
jgi:hypothetical protein